MLGCVATHMCTEDLAVAPGEGLLAARAAVFTSSSSCEGIHTVAHSCLRTRGQARTSRSLASWALRPRRHRRIHMPSRARAGAWNLSLGRVGANQIIVSPDRVELSNTHIQLGRHVNVHLNGELAYPRYVPHPDWAEQFNFLPSRVCLKVDW